MSATGGQAIFLDMTNICVLDQKLGNTYFLSKALD